MHCMTERHDLNFLMYCTMESHNGSLLPTTDEHRQSLQQLPSHSLHVHGTPSISNETRGCGS